MFSPGSLELHVEDVEDSKDRPRVFIVLDVELSSVKDVKDTVLRPRVYCGNYSMMVLLEQFFYIDEQVQIMNLCGVPCIIRIKKRI
jgi:hypothetical protein